MLVHLVILFHLKMYVYWKLNVYKRTLKQGKKYCRHHHGIAVDIAVYTLGANWFERHFTLDRTWKGTDQVFSLEPTGIRKLARDLRATKLALTYKKLKY